MGVAILILDKIEFNGVYNKRQRKALYNDKGITTRSFTLINIYTSNTRAPKYIKQITNRHKGRN